MLLGFVVGDKTKTPTSRRNIPGKNIKKAYLFESLNKMSFVANTLQLQVSLSTTIIIESPASKT
jgi:hypothetical protein